jgi:hypothetical protein
MRSQPRQSSTPDTASGRKSPERQSPAEPHAASAQRSTSADSPTASAQKSTSADSHPASAQKSTSADPHATSAQKSTSADPHATSAQKSTSAGLAFERDEWELIVTLPRRVLIAAVAAAPIDGQAAAEGIAGIEAIASGLASPSPLVREVVASIYAESHADLGEEPAGSTDGALVQTLAACRYAAEILSQRTSREDAEAYRTWIQHIAAVVTGVAQGAAGEVSATGRVGLADSRFLYALGGVLRA